MTLDKQKIDVSDSDSDSGIEIIPKKIKKPISDVAMKARMANLNKADTKKKEMDSVKREATKEKKLINNKIKVIDNLKNKYERLSGKSIKPDPEPESEKVSVEVVNHPKPVKKVATIKKVKACPVEEIKPRQEREKMIFA